MSNIPPQGSKIKVDALNGYQLIIIPQKSAGIAKYFIGAFLLFWLCGWLVGFVSVLSEITAGDAGFFLIFWLGGWSLGGVFAASMLYNVFKKNVPEQLLLNRPNLSLDTGLPTLQTTTSRRNRKANIKSLYKKRQRIEFSESEVKSLQLRETGTGNRLTIDKGTERLDIAASATEIEREWIFKYLQKNYTLT